MSSSFFWHDYETFGTDPARDRPSQFAGIRTNMELEEIGQPFSLYCQPPADMLPQPDACLITGITPQLAREKGVAEPQFIAEILQQMAQPGTCNVGYNSLRFDDEVTRHTLYRNFHDPYAREWQHGNSRWDLIDLVRMCRALRPAGIQWPDREDGLPSFKLEHLTEANGIGHANAHDALADVRATIALARLIKQQQPKLFDYLLQLRDKRRVAELLDLTSQKPLLYTSSLFSSARFCTSLVMPLCSHPVNKNAVIAWDLAVDPEPMLGLDAEQIQQRLFTPRAEYPESWQPLGLLQIQSNRCPALATSQLLDDALAQRIQLDLPAARRAYQSLRQAEKLPAILSQVYAPRPDSGQSSDPEAMLYSGGFFSENDKQTMAEVRNADTQRLSQQHFVFEDARLNELLFRYRARHFPESLSAEEQLQWQEFRYQRLTDPEWGASITLDHYQEIIQQRLAAPGLSEQQAHILQQLLDYGDDILA